MNAQEVPIQMLQSDLQGLEDRLRDEKFATDLYRALSWNPPPPNHGERQAPPPEEVDWKGLAEPEGRRRRAGRCWVPSEVRQTRRDRQ